MLVGIDTVLKEAQKGGYAVGAFNISNMEQTAAVLGAAVKKKSPVIIQFSEINFLNRKLDSLFPKPGEPQVLADAPGQIRIEDSIAMIRALATDLPIPVVVHLDHGHIYEGIVRAIRGGCTSVMFDGSTLPFEENVGLTSEIVKIAHAARVTVEGEIGHVGYGSNYTEDKHKFLTEPEAALDFAVRTGIDCLAVAVGTAHGQYVGAEPEIDFNRLASIRKITDVPLVLHGGSSTGDENLAKAISYGITKVNIATDLALAATKGIKNLVETAKRWNVLQVLITSMNAYADTAGHYMDIFSSTGKAK